MTRCSLRNPLMTGSGMGPPASGLAGSSAACGAAERTGITKRSKGRRRPRSISARQSPDGAAARTRLQELLVEQPDINGAAAAALIERSPSYTWALLAELRSEGA